MFERTKAAFNKTVRDIKKLIFLFTVSGLVVNVAYLIYALVKPLDNPIANWVLLGTTVAYLLFYLIITGFGRELDGNKSLKKGVKILFKWLKRLVKVYTFAIAVYGICINNGNVTPLFIVLIGGQALAVVFGLVFDLLAFVVERRAQLFIDGFMADIEPVLKIKRGIDNVSRFFHREPKISDPTPNENQLYLEQLAAQDAAAKARQERVSHAKLRVEKAEQDLAKAQEKGNKRAIRGAEKYLETMQEELAAAQAEIEPTPPEKKKGFSLFQKKPKI